MDFCDHPSVPLICPTRQVHESLHSRERSAQANGPRPGTADGRSDGKEAVDVFRCCRADDPGRLVLRRRKFGFIGSDVCRYGGSFCQNPHYVLVGAIVAGLWGAFVSVR